MYKIYKIVDNTNGNVYIGITTQTLKRRLSNHRCSANTCISREIIKNGDYKIELIEETDDKTRERYWVENTECINREIPGRTQEEWCAIPENREKRNEKRRQRYAENKEKAKEAVKAWRAIPENREKVNEKARQRYAENIEREREKRRQRRAIPENREKRNEKERQRRAKKKLMRNQ